MANLDKDAFLAAVIHDLRAPLNACMMSLNLLELKASQPADVLRCAAVVRRNLDRQARLIQDLADALQIMTGALEVDAAAADAAALACSACDEYRAFAEERGIELEAPPGAAGATVEADHERLTRALGTLVEYVLASASSGERVSLRIAKSGDQVRIAVERAAPRGDTGSAAAAKEQKGFNVRLSIAEQIIEAHGGALGRLEHGFEMRLPRRRTT